MENRGRLLLKKFQNGDIIKIVGHTFLHNLWYNGILDKEGKSIVYEFVTKHFPINHMAVVIKEQGSICLDSVSIYPTWLEYLEMEKATKQEEFLYHIYGPKVLLENKQ